MLAGYRLLANMMREASAWEWVSNWKYDWYHSGAMRRAHTYVLTPLEHFPVSVQANYMSRRIVMWYADLGDIKEQCQCQAHPLRWVFSFKFDGDKINLSHDFISTRWSKGSQWVPGAKFISSSNKLKKPTLLDLSETQTAGQWNKENNAGIVPRANPYWWQDLFDPCFHRNTLRSVDIMYVHRLACPKPEHSK